MPRQKASYLVSEAPIPGIDLEGFCQTPNIMLVKAMRAKFTAADWCLWAYLQAIDPHGDRMQDLPTPKEIGEAIGLSERQVKRSLSNLEEAGVYSYEVVKLQGHNIAGALAKDLCKKKREKKTADQSKMTNLSQTDKFVQDETDLSQMNRFVQDETDLSSDIYIDRARDQTYLDFIQTLSDNERESFEKFVRKNWKEEIRSVRAFLSDKEYLEEWYGKFLASPAGREAKKQAIAVQYAWDSDPRLLDWLYKAYYEGYLWTQADEVEREQRTAFFFWAQETNAYAGRIADEPA